MRIVVCLKHVSTNNTHFNNGKKILISDNTSEIINPNDRVAIELALKNSADKDEIIALSMGPPEAEESLREAIAMGINRAILLTDKKFSGSDTLATAYVLHMAIRKIKEVDLIICGERTIDSDTGHIGPQLAEYLQLPLLTYVTSFSIHNSQGIIAERICDNFQETIEAELPALLTINHRINDNIYPSFTGLIKAHNESDITIWNFEEINAEIDKIGQFGSATFVKKIITPQKKRQATIFTDDGSEKTINKLFKHLKEKNFITKQTK